MRGHGTDRDAFGQPIQQFRRRTPFHPFTVTLVSREKVEVDIGSSVGIEKLIQAGVHLPGRLYASIHKEKGKVVMAELDPGKNSFQPIAENDKLFGKGEDFANAPVKIGHIYVIRITDEEEKSFERLVKILVVEHRPNESVTIRWQLLE